MLTDEQFDNLEWEASSFEFLAKTSIFEVVPFYSDPSDLKSPYSSVILYCSNDKGNKTAFFINVGEDEHGYNGKIYIEQADISKYYKNR